jgi:hypothetical protein
MNQNKNLESFESDCAKYEKIRNANLHIIETTKTCGLDSWSQYQDKVNRVKYAKEQVALCDTWLTYLCVMYKREQMHLIEIDKMKKVVSHYCLDHVSVSPQPEIQIDFDGVEAVNDVDYVAPQAYPCGDGQDDPRKGDVCGAWNGVIRDDKTISAPILLGAGPPGKNKVGKKMKERKFEKKKKRPINNREAHLSFGKQLAQPDVLDVTYKYHSPQTEIATTLNNPFYQVLVNMTSMNQIINAGGAATIPYWNQGIQENYKRYLVTHDSIMATFKSTGVATPLAFTAVVVPVLDVTTVNTDTQFINYASLPMSKIRAGGQSTGQNDVVVIKNQCAPAKLFDTDQYFVQDEYSGAAGGATLADPTTMAYWLLLFRFDRSTLVAATGTLSIGFTIKRRVKIYEIERDSNVQLKERMRSLELEKELKELKEKVSNIVV